MKVANILLEHAVHVYIYVRA